MEPETYTGYVIRENGTHERIEFVDTLDEMHRIVECETIDIIDRCVGKEGQRFRIVCDDEGRLNDRGATAIYYVTFEVALVGNLLIVRKGESPSKDFASLTDEDVAYIRRYIYRNFGPGAVLGLMP